MDYRVVDQINFDKDNARKIGAFWYDEKTDGLYHESPWPFPVQLLIEQNLTKVYVTPMMLKLPFILKGWLNLDILLREIELLKLVQQDKILMHGSCVDNSLIIGFPNSGKTYQTYKTVSEGGTLISEEYTILYKGIGNKWIAKPYKPIMRTCFSQKTFDVCGMKLTPKEKAWLFFTTLRANLFPFMHEAVIWREIPVSGKTAEIKNIQYGSTKEEIKDWKTFAILCENEFPFMSSDFLQAYAVASGFDILGIQERQKQLIKMFVESVYPRS